MESTTWTIVNDQAQITVGKMSAMFDLTAPSDGLTLQWNKSIITQRLFAILVNDDPVETVVRHNDLIVRLPNRNSDLVSYEFYFRADPLGQGIDLLLSAQTDLLDSQPKTKVVTKFPIGETSVCQGSEVSRVSATAKYGRDQQVEYFLHRPTAQAQSSLLLMSHPTDFFEASADEGDDQGSSATYSVFPTSLEKGVIRRARFRARVIDREQDEQVAQTCLGEFAREAPPLAT